MLSYSLQSDVGTFFCMVVNGDLFPNLKCYHLFSNSQTTFDTILNAFVH